MNKSSDSRRSAVEAAPAASNAPVDLRSARILVVDDELGRQIRFTLEQDGCSDVTLAFDGFEALEYAEKSRFDLILLNYRMPRMNGADALRILRNRGSDTPVIMISAWDRDEIPESLDDLDLDEYIEKPFSTKLLVSRVEQVLAKHSRGSGGANPRPPIDRSTQ